MKFLNKLSILGVVVSLTSPLNIYATTKEEKFIQEISEYAQELCYENDLYASVMIAQASLETGFGSSGLSSPPYYNLFGIKGTYNGEGVTMRTSEYQNNTKYYVNATFRDYPSYKESLEDYKDLMIRDTYDIYKNSYKSNTSSYKEATKNLVGRYATDPNYNTKLNYIIEQFDLTQYDLKPPEPIEQTEISYNLKKIESPLLSHIVTENDDFYCFVFDDIFPPKIYNNLNKITKQLEEVKS